MLLYPDSTELESSLVHLFPQVLYSHRVSIHQTPFHKNDLQCPPHTLVVSTSHIPLHSPIRNRTLLIWAMILTQPSNLPSRSPVPSSSTPQVLNPSKLPP